MKLRTINRYLRWFGIVLVIECGDGDWCRLYFDWASRHPMVET